MQDAISSEHDPAALLNALPAETHPQFALKVRRVLDTLDDPVGVLIPILDDTAQPERVRFAALYGSLVTLWRRRDFAEYRALVDRHSAAYDRHPLFLTFRAQYYSSAESTVGNLQVALQSASDAVERMGRSPNVLHLFTEVVVDLNERWGEAGDRLESAEQMIDRAIAITGGTYAKYFATKARVLAARGRFAEARQTLQAAFEKEPSASVDYAIRLANYETIRASIRFAEQLGRLRQEHAESLAKMEEVRGHVLEMLGLLSAIIAFLVTSVQIAREFKFYEAIRLLIASGGIILIVFGSYSLVFYSKRLSARQVIVLGIGATMLAFALSSSALTLL